MRFPLPSRLGPAYAPFSQSSLSKSISFSVRSVIQPIPVNVGLTFTTLNTGLDQLRRANSALELENERLRNLVLEGENAALRARLARLDDGEGDDNDSEGSGTLVSPF